jgi:hypothetical protein
MKGSPAPGVVRYPCVSVVGHRPVTVGGVRVEIVPYIGNPDMAVIAVVDPSSVRSQFIVEDIEAYTAVVIVVIIVLIITIICIIIVVILTLRICAPGSIARRQQQCDYREE